MKTRAQPHQTATLMLSDADLVYMAQSALTWNRALPPGAIKASVTAGWLTLSGQVKWHYQRQDAAECVRYLPGLAGLSNDITLPGTGITCVP